MTRLDRRSPRGRGRRSAARLCQPLRDLARPELADNDPDKWLWTSTIITRAASDALGHVHDRCPGNGAVGISSTLSAGDSVGRICPVMTSRAFLLVEANGYSSQLYPVGRGLEVGPAFALLDPRLYSPSTQRCSTRAPASPDFSGWNWVAESGPFSTAATKRSPPCSAQVTTGGVNGCSATSSQSRTA